MLPRESPVLLVSWGPWYYLLSCSVILQSSQQGVLALNLSWGSPFRPLHSIYFIAPSVTPCVPGTLSCLCCTKLKGEGPCGVSFWPTHLIPFLDISKIAPRRPQAPHHLAYKSPLWGLAFSNEPSEKLWLSPTPGILQPFWVFPLPPAHPCARAAP